MKISVRNLIEFLYKQGDIDDRVGSLSAAQEGTKVHKMLQRELKEQFEGSGEGEFSSEVFLSRELSYKDIDLTLEGRADGIILKAKSEAFPRVKIVEIKSTMKDMAVLDENENFLHWAQGKLYCYLYCEEHEEEDIELELIYCHRDTFYTKTFSKILTREELHSFYEEIMERYIVWVKLQSSWIEKRNATIEKLEFPFGSYRKGQRELAVNIYRTIKEKKNIYIEAPTGTGKTISTLFPAIKALNIYKEAKLTYLTAKNITKGVVEETLGLLKDKGLSLRTLTITAKEKICFLEEKRCNGEDCIYAKGHFDRVNDTIIDLLSNEESLTQEKIEKYSLRHKVCPFELSLDLIQWSDLILCDYNYFFDPKAMIKRVEFDSTPYIFLIDEAHNLIDRGREMYSIELSTKVYREAKEVFKKKNKKLRSCLDKIIKEMKEITLGEEEEVIFKAGPSSIMLLLSLFVNEGEKYLKEKQGGEVEEEFLEAYFNAMDFVRIGELFSEEFVFYGKNQEGEPILKLFCLNPSALIEKSIKGNISTVFFSATLSPMGYFKRLLGNGENDYSMKLPSPFPPENKEVIVKTDVDTRYRYREKNYDKIATYIHEGLSYKKGNFLVFFPSFEFMMRVYDIFTDKYEEYSIIIQESAMGEEARREFLENFENQKEGHRAVGFVVLGGVFSEGIDLWGDKLKGAIIVGVGLPKLTFETKLIEEYFNKKEEPGFHYAYTFPGMNKVIQAMGRVIRREEDTGVIILLDKRYKLPIYKSLIPL